VTTTPEDTVEVHRQLREAQARVQELGVELRRHVAALREANWAPKDIAGMLGVTPGRISQLSPTVLTPRLRPVRAILWDGSNYDAVQAFVGAAKVAHDEDDPGLLWIKTALHGWEECRRGDSIIEGITDHYPVSPEVIAQSYEGPESF
jgi:hypothetical protein